MQSHRSIIIALLVVGSLMVGSWIATMRQIKTQSAANRPKPYVAATIYPIYDIVRNVAGSDKTVMLVVSPGESPEAYNPETANSSGLKGTKILFTVDNGVDPWAALLARKLGIETIIGVGQNLNLAQENAGSYYWLSLPHASAITETVAEALAADDPENADNYRNRAREYQSQLEELNRYGHKLRDQAPEAASLSLPRQWQYFAHDFNVTAAAASPSAVVLDAFGGSIAADTYVNLMKTNFETLFSASITP